MIHTPESLSKAFPDAHPAAIEAAMQTNMLDKGRALRAFKEVELGFYLTGLTRRELAIAATSERRAAA